jgi:hypothetical protein
VLASSAPHYPGTVGLPDDLALVATHAAPYALAGEHVVGVMAAETEQGRRVYLCALGTGDGSGPAGWISLGSGGAPVADRDTVREAVSIAALCEVAGDAAFPGDLDELRARLVQVRITEAPPGIEEAELAAAELQRTLGVPPQLATPARLDAIGAAALRLEAALSDASAGSRFGDAMRRAQTAVDAVVREVEAGHRVPLR